MIGDAEPQGAATHSTPHVSAAHMSAEEFVASTFVIPVRSVDSPARVARLEVPQEHQDRLEAMRQDAAASMRAMGAGDASALLVTKCLDIELRDDLWHSTLPSGKVVILVRHDVFSQLPERVIAEQVHKREVEAAIKRGEAVPLGIIDYYRHKPAPALPPTGY